MDETYSIRESLQGRLQSFIRDSGIHSIFLEDVIRDLVVLLSSYREEDIPMFPSVFVAARKVDASSIFTAGAPMKIGGLAQTSDVASIVIKDCAPLAKEGWAIFIFLDEEDNQVHYGVFRSARHSLSTGADETISDLGSSVQLMLLKNCGHQSVEIHNTSRRRLTAVLKIPTSAPAILDVHIAKFIEAATANIAEPFELRAYLKRVLAGIVQHCHGTLLAVAATAESAPNPVALQSGIVPTPCIDFAVLHKEAMKLRDADSLADLRSAEVLLTGMIGSDGIVVFGSEATVRAYRSFIKPDPEESARLPVEGGARRRAFELMKLRMGSHYSAALYRSQDGETKCEVLL